MDIKAIRRDNINKGRLLSNETNKLKGLKRFVIGKNKRENLNNELIDLLLENGYYSKIYNIWMKNTNDMVNYKYYDSDEEYNDMFKDLSNKDVDILKIFNYEEPDKLISKKQGLTIEEKQL